MIIVEKIKIVFASTEKNQNGAKENEREKTHAVFFEGMGCPFNYKDREIQSSNRGVGI